MAPILSLSCFGPPQVAAVSGDPVRFRTRKHLALLVRLAVEPGRKFTRDYLTDLLWPDAPARLANHSLAQALSVIREKLGRAHVLVQRATVALGEGAVDADVHHLDGPDVEIRGAFLDGFDLPAARPFEDWKDEWRAKLLPKMRDALVRHMDAGRRVGDFAAVERHAGVLYELDPLSEDAVRGTIEARAWAGDRSSALKAYAAYEARLAQELGAKPGADLQRMADLLREGRPGATSRARAVGEPVARVERRFEAETVIGREREFSVLYDAWLAARRRAPAIVVLTGDPGLGKTTLANAFVSTCQLEGAVVARAQAYDAERELPFAVLAELVRQLALQRAIGGAEPEALSELSRLTPEVVAQFPGVPKPVEWAAEIVPLRLADAFLKTVTAAAEESPVVLVVDDIHAADNASTAILHMVARKLAPTRLLVILATRSAELRASGAPGALTSDASIGALRPLDLEPLPDESATRLVERVRAVATGALDADFPLERVLRAGRGNPLALELLTREWVAHGPESLLRDLEAVNTQPAAAIGIPRAIKAVFERQVARLDAKTRAALDLAAVLGRRLGELWLYEVADCTPLEAGEALARLRDVGVLREVRGDLEFRNELIRAQAYYAVPVVARHHLHRAVGKSLAGRDSAVHKRSPLETAWHFLRGGDVQQAVSHALEGAEASRSAGAPLEAEQVLRAVIDSLPTEERVPTLSLALARALLDQSKARAAAPLLDDVLTSAALPDRMQAEASVLRAAAEYVLNRESGRLLIAISERALAAARGVRDPDLIVRSLFEYARAGAECGNAEMVANAMRSVSEVIEAANGHAAPRAYLTLGYCHFFFYRASETRRFVQTALDLLCDSGDLPMLSICYSGLGGAQLNVGNCDAALSSFQKALECAQKIGDDSRASLIMSNMCAVHSAAGRFEEAIAHGRSAIDLGRRAVSQPFMIATYTNLIDPYTLTGRVEEALECMEQAKQWIDDTSPSWLTRAAYLGESAGLALMMGNQSLALEYTAALEEEASGRELGLPWPGFYHRMRAFRAAHEIGYDAAFEIVDGSRTLLSPSPLHYSDVIAALAWLEKRARGATSSSTLEELAWLQRKGLRGRIAMISAQGFLDESHVVALCTLAEPTTKELAGADQTSRHRW